MKLKGAHIDKVIYEAPALTAYFIYYIVVVTVTFKDGYLIFFNRLLVSVVAPVRS